MIYVLSSRIQKTMSKPEVDQINSFATKLFSYQYVVGLQVTVNVTQLVQRLKPQNLQTIFKYELLITEEEKVMN